jgi:MYND finger
MMRRTDEGLLLQPSKGDNGRVMILVGKVLAHVGLADAPASFVVEYVNSELQDFVDYMEKQSKRRLMQVHVEATARLRAAASRHRLSRGAIPPAAAAGPSAKPSIAAGDLGADKDFRNDAVILAVVRNVLLGEPIPIVRAKLERFQCMYCASPSADAHKACGRCRMAHYCSVDCQTKDWPEHKKWCITRVVKKVAAAAPSGAADGSSGDKPTGHLLMMVTP